MSIPLLSEVESAEIADAAHRIKHRKRVWVAMLVVAVFIVLKVILDIFFEVMIIADHVKTSKMMVDGNMKISAVQQTPSSAMDNQRKFTVDYMFMNQQ